MIRHLAAWAGGLAVIASAVAVAGQAKPVEQPPPTRPPGTATAKPAASPAASRTVLELAVTDASGNPVQEGKVTMTGPVSREGSTGKDGALTFQGLKPGSYRLRVEATDFITLERDVTIKVGAPNSADMMLDRAVKVPPPTPTPTPTPPPPPPHPAVAPSPGGDVELVSLPDWIEKNLIGRNDPQKETVVGRSVGAVATVLQVREPIKDRVHADADELLYVIAGQGILKARGQEQALDPGSFVLIPRGVSFSLERRGRNPLTALSIVGQ
jgi:mannose-6-phosphate isomerase-like protein (cupin superfamily)